MNRYLLTAVFFILNMFLIPNLFSQDLIQNIDARNTLSLNGRWNYIIDPYQMGYLDYRQQPFDESESGTGGFFDNRVQEEKDERLEYDFNQSPTLKVPADWNSQSEKLELYEGTIWYKRDFTVELLDSKRYFVHFGAVNYEAHVYLNGEKLGVHKGGFTPFQFEVTSKIKDGDNFLVVMVDNTRKKDAVPTVNTDWWNYGGITRDVNLVITPETFISDYKVQLAQHDPNILQGFVKFDGNNLPKTVKIKIPELQFEKDVELHSEALVSFEYPIKNVETWSPDYPKLYDVILSTTSNTIADKIGFRTIKTQGQDILLNNESIFLKGISIHDENPLAEGRLRSYGDMRMMLMWAKELGCNFVRLAHYTHNEKMLKLADELGLMVWAEIPVYWTISWENPETFELAEAQLSAGIKRDKNRASVIIWSVGNETPVKPARNEFMRKLVEKVRQLDSSRLVAAALEVEVEGNVAKVNDPLGQYLDLASFNEYAGWYWGNVEDMSEYEFSIAYDKPVVITEFGAGALQGFHGDKNTIWTEEHQAYLYENQIKMLEKIEGLRGMSPWILADFRSPRRQHPVYQNFWNRKGLISESGQKKKAFHVLKKYYSEKELD
ncbi:beta-glucuronidase [Gramella sp. BOM4]|nr:beta-glucuronidase [Christiangramia bathymodioli]